MKFTAKEAVQPAVVPGTYSVEIKVMGGDADYYDSFTVAGFRADQDEPLLQNLIELLLRLDGAYPNGRGGSDEYSLRRVDGFSEWFDEEELSDEVSSFYAANKLRRSELGLSYTGFPYWPDDVTMGDDCFECDYESHAVFYYDENLTKHRVEVEL